MNILLHLSEYIIPVLILSILLFAVVKKINAYEEFVGGAKDGLKTVVAILPTLIGLLVAVRVLRASGFLEFMSRGIGYILRGTGLPNEIIPLVIVKMFSSSAATGLCLDIFKNCGADSDTGFMSSVIMSCTETIFYTMSVYYMAAKVTKTRWTLAGSLISSVAGVAASIFITMMR